MDRALPYQADNQVRSQTDESKEMSFLEHLEELRWHIVKALVGILIGTVVCGYYVELIVHQILMKPLLATGLKAQVLTPYGIVLLYMQAMFICGIIISMPNTLYWLWKFVSPGLLPKERKYISLIVGFTSLCFFAGVAFAYFILLPTALTFFAGFGTQSINLNVSIDHYISFVLTLLFGAGLVFELPMVSYFLSKMGLLTPAFLRHYRRHALIVILVIAALVTPSPDIITQVMLAVPMILLYEIGVLVSIVVTRKQGKIAESES
jgi:sec-independent protein translocase protein TatC